MIKKILNNTLTVAAVVSVAVFFTAWLNVIPTFWQVEIMDTPILWGITVRTVITFLVIIIPTILMAKTLKNFIPIICLAALLPAMVLLLKLTVFWNGQGPELAVTYPMYGIMLVWVTSLWIESIILEFIAKTFSFADVIEDLLFSIALATLFYGITTVSNVHPFSGTSLAMSPVLALVQLKLSKTFHTPKRKVHSSPLPPGG